MKPDINGVIDRQESVAMMEPMQIGDGSRRRAELTELALELATRSTGLRRSLPDAVVGALAELVRAMNCYYSNLIEGHNTHPLDIERAMVADYSAEPRQRNLQLEARAHVSVQRWIDAGGLHGCAATAEAICEIHRRFGALLPQEPLWVDDPDTGERNSVEPGALRARDIRVGRHVAISPGAVARFLERFEQVYRGLGRAETIVSAAAAHHRLLWIHPFLDGNGRVARLLSSAMLHDALEPGGIWSVARGLARQEGAYKAHLAACDRARRNDLDGRGSLSEEALAEFTHFFLLTCLDQVAFMEGLVQPGRLRDRILLWAEEEARGGRLPAKAGSLLEAVLFRGELPRADVPALVGTGERQARRVVSALLEAGVVTSSSTRAPLRIAFPAALAGRWLPGLFPEMGSAPARHQNRTRPDPT